MTSAAHPRSAKGGRPRGSHPINRAGLVSAFNRAVFQHAEELMNRAVQNALEGDRDALAGLLALVGHAMSDAGTTPTAGARQ